MADWDRREDETQRAYEVFCQYLELGPRDRSLDKVRQQLGKPSGYTRWLEEWSSKYDWVARAEAHDQMITERRREEYEKEMTTGLSNAGARVRKLKCLHDRLEDELDDSLWVDDVKITPQGDTIPIQKYNAPLVRNYLSVLDDIAAEVGGRKKQVDVTTQGQALDGGIDVAIEGAVPMITRPGDSE